MVSVAISNNAIGYLNKNPSSSAPNEPLVHNSFTQHSQAPTLMRVHAA